MYYPQRPQKEPSGCLQALVISKAMIAILLVPILLILGAIIGIVLAFYALTISPFLALLVVLGGAGVLVGLGKWESRRVAKEMPHDEEP